MFLFPLTDEAPAGLPIPFSLRANTPSPLHDCMKKKKKIGSDILLRWKKKRTLTGLASLVTLRDTEHVEPSILKEDSTLMLAERG